MKNAFDNQISKNNTYDVIVIGAGYIGCAVAYYLSNSGLKTALFDQGSYAHAASGANFGNIQVQDMELEHSVPLILNGVKSFETLADELDWPITKRKIGSLLLIENENQLDIMNDRKNRLNEIGIHAEILSCAHLNEAEPYLSTKHLLGALYHPDEAQIDPFELMKVMLLRALQNGLHPYFYTEVTGFDCEGERIKSIHTTKGKYSSEHLVICTGAYTTQLGKLLNRSWPIHYVLGQAIVTEHVPFILNNHLTSASFFESGSSSAKDQLTASMAISQSSHGNIMIGETMIEASHFHRTIPAGALPLIANCWLNYFYKLRNLQILRSWSAPVADMPDGLPLLGPVPHMKGVYLATAFRSTVVVTPLVGKLITQLITTGKSDLDILQFTPERKFYVPN